MRYEYFVLWLVLGTSLRHSSAATPVKSAIVAARSPGNVPAETATKPTAAPLLTSTPRPPLDGATPTTPAPTEAAADSPIIIINAPPSPTERPTKEEMAMVEKFTGALPQKSSTTADGSSTKTEPTAPNRRTALDVIGLITKDGNIYEVTTTKGIGKIESRQSRGSETNSHVCNYGSVVIYSDMPCDEVINNVRISEVQQNIMNTDQEQVGAAAQPSYSAAVQSAADGESESSNSNALANENAPDFDDGPRKVPKRRRVNKNRNKQRRRNANRNGSNGLRRGAAGAGVGASKKRRRQQQQAQQHRHRQQTKHNRYQQQQKRKRQPQQQKRQPQKKQRRPQKTSGKRRNGQRRKNPRGGENFNKRRYSDIDVYNVEHGLKGKVRYAENA